MGGNYYESRRAKRAVAKLRKAALSSHQSVVINENGDAINKDPSRESWWAKGIKPTLPFVPRKSLGNYYETKEARIAFASLKAALAASSDETSITYAPRAPTSHSDDPIENNDHVEETIVSLSCEEGMTSTLIFDDLSEDEVHSQEHSQECLICFECQPLESHSTSFQELPCGHSFHSCCLNEWRPRIDTCPMCRADLELVVMHC